MKNIHNYIMLLVATLVFVSCSEDEIVPNNNQVQPGGNVQLGLSLENLSRTIYDEEYNNAFPIYWSEGDKVIVASPHCAPGRNNAVYEVTPVAGQAYAEAITKVGESAVQWGSSQTADFYSVFPSKNATLSVPSENNVTASLKINSEQNAALVLNGNVYSAADMDNVVMYAMTQNVTNGEIVDLQYIPYSTVLEFEVNVTADVGKSIFIQSMTLTAPIAIAGNFNLAFPATDTETPSVFAVGNNNSNSIKMNFASAPQLDATNTTLKAKFCLMPISDVENLNGWTIALEVREGNNEISNYTKTLTLNTALTPGKVHKIKLPALTALKEWEYIPSNWMPQLPEYKTIYLTELSIPGAWYAGAKVNDGYQSTQSITDLWNAGIRAFAVETRTIVSSTNIIVTTYPMATPSDVVVSGTADNSGLVSYSVGTNSLMNESLDANESGNGYVYKKDANNITVQKIMKDIVACVKQQAADENKKSEFAVLVLSYSESGKSGMRYVDFGAWLQLIYDAYAGLTDEEKSYIYNKEINADTVIGEVLNKVIIKINVDANIAMGGYVSERIALVFNDTRNYMYENNLPALFSYTPFLSQLANNDSFSVPIFSKMYWMNWGDNPTYRSYTTTTSADFLWCFSSANRTHADSDGTFEIPTYAQRKTALEAMMEYSDKIYANSTHNVWFYFNAGGIEAEDRTTDTSGSGATTFASKMNPWLKTIIDLKINGGTDENGMVVSSNPSPLGIVMFNQCTNSTYKGPEIIRAIIEMNNKFNLKHASGNSNIQSQTRDSYDSSLSNGGNVISLD